MTPPAVRHYVYRCYDADDRLLYIGCTEDLVSRFAVHASSWSNPVSGTLNLARQLDEIGALFARRSA